MNTGHMGLAFIILFLVLLAHVMMRDRRPKLTRRYLAMFVIQAIGFFIFSFLLNERAWIHFMPDRYRGNVCADHWLGVSFTTR
jgi:hypothetical protein